MKSWHRYNKGTKPIKANTAKHSAHNHDGTDNCCFRIADHFGISGFISTSMVCCWDELGSIYWWQKYRETNYYMGLKFIFDCVPEDDSCKGLLLLTLALLSSALNWLQYLPINNCFHHRYSQFTCNKINPVQMPPFPFPSKITDGCGALICLFKKIAFCRTGITDKIA